MPVTAKLSRRFYEKLGDELTNELVDWFNIVDATYRTDLDRLHELNVARFDAKLEQRFAAQDARWERRFSQLDAKWDRRLADLEVRWEHRLAEQDVKWEKRFAELEVTLELRFSRLEAKVDQRFALQDVKWAQRLAVVRTDLVRWMFAFWTGNLLALAGFLFVILKSRPPG